MTDPKWTWPGGAKFLFVFDPSAIRGGRRVRDGRVADAATSIPVPDATSGVVVGPI